MGLGFGLKNSGLGNGFLEIVRAVVRFGEDGDVEVRHCWTEMGQGVHTVALQVAVEELGVDPGRVRVLVDTTRELGAGQTTGSRGTVMGAGAVSDACRRAIADGCRPGVDYEGEYRVDWTNSLDEGLENPVIHAAFSYAAQLVVLDRETGKIDKVVAVHDVGRAVNPLLCEGQIQGAVHMGLGYALSEEFPCDDEGRPHEHDAPQPRHHPGQGRADDRRRSSSRRPSRDPPTGSRVSARSASCPRRGRSPRPCTTWTAFGARHCRCGCRWAQPRAWLTNEHSEPRRHWRSLEPGVTSGLVCGHHHLYSALARGMPAPPRTPHNFQEILELVWWRLDCALDLEMIRWSAMLGALEALEAGTTAIVDHHASPNAIEGSLSVIADACAEVGVRVCCCYEVTDRNGPDGMRAGLAENERFLRAGGRGFVGAHACFTLSRVQSRAGGRTGGRSRARACTSTSPRIASTRPRASGSRD